MFMGKSTGNKTNAQSYDEIQANTAVDFTRGFVFIKNVCEGVFRGNRHSQSKKTKARVDVTFSTGMWSHLSFKACYREFNKLVEWVVCDIPVKSPIVHFAVACDNVPALSWGEWCQSAFCHTGPATQCQRSHSYVHTEGKKIPFMRKLYWNDIIRYKQEIPEATLCFVATFVFTGTITATSSIRIPKSFSL